MGAPHGVRGEVALHSLSGETDHLTRLTEVELRLSGEDSRVYRVASVRQAASKMIVRFDGIDTRDDARALGGWEVWVARQAASPLGADEYYLADLYGAGVLQAGRRVGVVVGVLPGGASDLLEVSPADRRQASSFYVPFLMRFVTAVDVTAGIVELAPGYQWGNGA